MLNIRVATNNDIAKIEDLRITAYQTGVRYKIADPSFLLCGKDDSKSIIFLIEDSSKNIISTMRGTVVNSMTALEEIFDISLNSKIIPPFFSLSRAATFYRYRRLGYTSVLRLLFIQVCLELNIQNIVLIIREDASRVTILDKLGFKFEEADLSKRIDSKLISSSSTLFSVLEQQFFSSAIETAKQMLVTPLSNFAIEDGLIEKSGAILSPNIPLNYCLKQ